MTVRIHAGLARLGLMGIIALLLAPGAALAQMDDVTITTTDLGHGIYMLQGAGGNLGMSAGAEGVFLIDDQFAPLTDKIKAAIGEVSDEEIRFVLNTHWHGDHTGGNENLGQGGTLIVAHDNVRKRMSSGQFSEYWKRDTPAAAAGALPVVTFNDVVTFHLNGLEIQAFHVHHAHTDGDALIHFVGANIIHMGDTYFNGLYPFVDWESGGSTDGMIATANRVLDMIDDDTKVIPGHGPLSNKAELTEFRDMLVTVSDRVKALLAEGKKLEQILAAKPSAEYDEALGEGWLTPTQFLEILVGDLSR